MNLIELVLVSEEVLAVGCSAGAIEETANAEILAYQRKLSTCSRQADVPLSGCR